MGVKVQGARGKERERGREKGRGEFRGPAPPCFFPRTAPALAIEIV